MANGKELRNWRKSSQNKGVGRVKPHLVLRNDTPPIREAGIRNMEPLLNMIIDFVAVRQRFVWCQKKQSFAMCNVLHF